MNNFRCVINDIIENQRYKLKFNINMLKKLHSIYKEKDINFFKINSTEIDTNIFLSPFESHFIDLSYKNLAYIFKKDKDNNITILGKRVEKVLVYSNFIETSYIKKRGILLKYINGDKCDYGQEREYDSYLFITCDKDNSNYLPKLAKIINSIDNLILDCTFIFEWTHRVGCPQCLKGECKVFKESCKNTKMRVFYQETNDCIIINGFNNQLLGLNYSNSENLIENDYFDKDKIMKYYFNNYDYERSTPKSSNVMNETYIDQSPEYELCSDNHSNLILIVGFPILYILTFLVLIYFCIKYKRKTSTLHSQIYQKEIVSKEIKNTIEYNEIIPIN